MDERLDSTNGGAGAKLEVHVVAHPPFAAPLDEGVDAQDPSYRPLLARLGVEASGVRIDRSEIHTGGSSFIGQKTTHH